MKYREDMDKIQEVNIGRMMKENIGKANIRKERRKSRKEKENTKKLSKA